MSDLTSNEPRWIEDDSADSYSDDDIRFIENTEPHPLRFQAMCGRCGWHWPKVGYVTKDLAWSVHSQHDCSMRECCCTQDGRPYCGDPECDIDFCTDCGEEYTNPCPRHESVNRP